MRSSLQPSSPDQRKAFQEGACARWERKLLTLCPYADDELRAWWEYGWHAQNNALSTQVEEPGNE